MRSADSTRGVYSATVIAPAALLCPLPLAEHALDGGQGYRRIYRLRGPAGEVAIQQVHTQIRLRCGEHTLADYAGTYAEWFRFDDDGELGHLGGRPVIDVHDFDLRRDAWDAMSLRRLTRERDLRDAQGRRCARSRELRLELTKRCWLGLGELDGAHPERTTPSGAAFGYLARGPLEASRVTLRLSCCGGGQARDVPLEAAAPGGAPTHGAGRWTADEGWLAREQFTYRFALRRGSLDEDSGYVVAPLPEPSY